MSGSSSLRSLVSGVSVRVKIRTYFHPRFVVLVGRTESYGPTIAMSLLTSSSLCRANAVLLQ